MLSILLYVHEVSCCGLVVNTLSVIGKDSSEDAYCGKEIISTKPRLKTVSVLFRSVSVAARVPGPTQYTGCGKIK